MAFCGGKDWLVWGFRFGGEGWLAEAEGDAFVWGLWKAVLPSYSFKTFQKFLFNFYNLHIQCTGPDGSTAL